jgi:Family of unknown function (DUF5335)
MPTQEIPHYEWERFFDEFSRLHRGWLVTIEMLGLDIRDQVQARDLPLEGIAIEPNEIGEDQITIIAGAQGDARISHTIDGPDRVWLKQNEEGADEALEIESTDSTVLLRFRSTVKPEMLDGVLAKSAKAN